MNFNNVDNAMIEGDLAKLSSIEKLQHYMDVCKSLGLNYLTKPLGYILMPGGKMTLYALKSCTDQLRAINGVNIESITTTLIGDIVTVTAVASDKTGRRDTDIGCVSIANMKGDLLANAHMKAITKAKRRVTLSLCGLGWLDETEVETIPAAKIVPDNIIEAKTEPALPNVALKEPSIYITETQLKELSSLKKLMGFTPAEASQWETIVKSDYGVASCKMLSVNDAEAIINDLKIMIKERTDK